MKMKKLLYVLVVVIFGLTFFSSEVKAQEGGTFECICTDTADPTNPYAPCIEWGVRTNSCDETYEPNLSRCTDQASWVDGDCNNNFSCIAVCDPVGSVSTLDWGDMCVDGDLTTQCEPGTGCRMDSTDTNDIYRCLKDINSLPEGAECKDTTECNGYADPSTINVACVGGVCLHRDVDDLLTISMLCINEDSGLTGIDTAIGCIPIETNVAMWTFMLRWAIGIAGGIAFLLIIYASFLIITSAGHPKKIQAGRELLTSAIAGLILLIFAVWLLRIIGADILGIFQ